MNEDLERRLEAEAKEKIHLESLREEDGRQLQLERKRQEDEKAVWMKKVKDDIRHRQIVEKRLRCAEKELSCIKRNMNWKRYSERRSGEKKTGRIHECCYSRRGQE